MRKILIGVVLLALAAPLMALSTAELRDIMMAEAPTVGQALKLAVATADPAADTSVVSTADYKRLARFADDRPLTVGIFSKIAIETGLAEGSLFYKITGSRRYATQSLQFKGIIPDEYSGNRSLSGPELVEFINTLHVEVGEEEVVEESAVVEDTAAMEEETVSEMEMAEEDVAMDAELETATSEENTELEAVDVEGDQMDNQEGVENE